MQLISVNVGRSRDVDWHGRTVRTSIWKSPVAGRVRAMRLGLEGDEQSDLSAHGGPNKAVYVYPSEHYAYWRRELPEADLPWGVFGENLTTDGLIEASVKVGDRLGIGSAEFVVTQPRMPCFKLGIRFGRDDIVKRFLQSGRSGFYVAVARGGEVSAGDRIAVIGWDARAVMVSDLVSLYAGFTDDQDLLRRAVEAPALPESWKDRFRKRISASSEPRVE